jgi:hypothetical protein
VHYYDTYAVPDSRKKLADAINDLPDGSTFVAGMSDAQKTGDALTSAMGSLGSKLFAGLLHREGWSFVAVKGGKVLAEDNGGGTDAGAIKDTRGDSCTGGKFNPRATKLLSVALASAAVQNLLNPV